MENMVVSWFLTFYHLLYNIFLHLKGDFLMHPDKGESQKVTVKQYEFYNRGLALSDPS